MVECLTVWGIGLIIGFITGLMLNLTKDFKRKN